MADGAVTDAVSRRIRSSERVSDALQRPQRLCVAGLAGLQLRDYEK